MVGLETRRINKGQIMNNYDARLRSLNFILWTTEDEQRIL